MESDMKAYPESRPAAATTNLDAAAATATPSINPNVRLSAHLVIDRNHCVLFYHSLEPLFHFHHHQNHSSLILDLQSIIST
jgi:hypothetical protein